VPLNPCGLRLNLNRCKLSFLLWKAHFGAAPIQRGGLVFYRFQRYICRMRSPKKKPTAAKIRSWRASLLRSRAIPLGIVHAADEKTAEAAAVEQFGLDDERRRRLAVREDG
jgi:hypothetical protein